MTIEKQITGDNSNVRNKSTHLTLISNANMIICYRLYDINYTYHNCINQGAYRTVKVVFHDFPRLCYELSRTIYVHFPCLFRTV